MGRRRVVPADGRHYLSVRRGGTRQLDAVRIASGNGALLPVCVSIQTTTTLPSEYSVLSFFSSTMRWPMVTLLR